MTTIKISQDLSNYILERMTYGSNLESISVCDDGTYIVKMTDEPSDNSFKQYTRTIFPADSKRASGGDFWKVESEEDLLKRPAKKSKKVLAK